MIPFDMCVPYRVLLCFQPWIGFLVEISPIYFILENLSNLYKKKIISLDWTFLKNVWSYFRFPNEICDFWI